MDYVQFSLKRRTFQWFSITSEFEKKYKSGACLVTVEIVCNFGILNAIIFFQNDDIYSFTV